MSVDQVIVVGILAAALVLFAWGHWRHDLVALSALLALVMFGIIPPDTAYRGFSHPAVITVAAMLVISAALEECGIVSLLVKRLNREGDGEAMTLALLAGVVTILSAFMNNVGALALMLPVTLEIAKRKEIPPSRLLMPVAFGSILGGLITLIGTPPNIIIATYREELTGEAFSLLDFAPVGLAIAAGGLLVMAFAARFLLPRRADTAFDHSVDQIRSYLTEIEIPEGSAFAGRSLARLEDIGHGNVNVVAIFRDDRRIVGPRSSFRLAEHDLLLVEADPASLQEFLSETHIELAAERESEPGTLSSDDVELVEAVVMPNARIESQTLERLHLHARYGVNVLAIARHGATLLARLGRVRIRVGDVLLVQGEAGAMTETLGRLGCLPVSGEGLSSRRFSLLPLLIFAAALLASGVGLVAIHIALVTAGLAIVVARFLPVRRVYESIDWSVIVLLAAMIPVGQSLETTGATGLAAAVFLKLLAGLPAIVVLGSLIVFAMALSNVVNNAATAILMAPLSIQIAAGLGFGPDPFLMAVAIGSSCAFATPIGHQSNLLVMGPGGYRFADYLPLGCVVSLAALVIGTPTILFIWPLVPV
jgi:di/tricarboxylate transporter